MNMNLDRLFLIISCIFMIIMYTKMITLEKKSLENFGNNNIVEHLESTEEDRVREIVKEEYNHDIEAIRNLGAISKSLLTGKNYHNTSTTDLQDNMLKIPANFMVMGNSLAVSVGTVIIWALSTPPPPNNQSNIVPFGPGNNADSWQLGSDDYWAPCTGETYNGKKTPDLRNRLPLGHGHWGGDLNSTGGGVLPLRNHSHNMRHRHNTVKTGGVDYNQGMPTTGAIADGRYNGGSHAYGLTMSQNDSHEADKGKTSHSQTNTGLTGHDAGGNLYNKDTIPYYSVVQYWMRVR